MVALYTKPIFMCHGIPKNNNQPQYSVDEYKKFKDECRFSHITTSPYHPQSNGLAEKVV